MKSLRRLRGTTVDLVGYDALRKKADARVASVETILDTLISQLDEIDMESGGEAGALRGNTLSVKFRAWMIESLRAGYVTYYRLAILRRLAGLAKRLWVYWRRRSIKG